MWKSGTVTILLIMVFLTATFMTLLLTQSLAASALPSKLAPPPVEWSKTYGGAGGQTVSSIKQTSDGGYALFGVSGTNGWLVKVDSKGVLQWNKTFSKSGYEVRILAGQQTSDGGYILAGGIPNTEVIDGMGYGDAIMIKTDGAGNVQWEKIFGGSGHQYAFSAQQTSDGDYILAGASTPPGVNNDDFLLIKTDSSGNTVWTKTFGDTTANEFANSVRQTSDGGYILAGEKLSFTSSWSDAWVVRTDASGNMVWNKVFSDLGKGRLYSVKQTSDSGYIIAGDRNQQPETGTGQYNDFWLLRLTSNGNVQWHTSFGGEGVRYDSAKSIQQNVDGGFIIVGRTGTYIWLLKTDSTGKMTWNKTFATSSPDESDVIQTSDRGYAVACSAPGDSSSVMLIKIMRANPPIVSCTGEPSNPMVGQEVVFNASATYDLDNDIRNYTWNFQDGNISTTTEPTISHSFSSPGNYNVTLTVTDSEDLTSSVTKEVYVRINTSISVSASSKITSSGLAVNITGALRDMLGQPVVNKPVILYYSLSQTRDWYPITSSTTDSAGAFSGTWLPSGTGQFSIKAEWGGDTIYSPSQNTTNLAITLTEDDFLFFVQSNSTITTLMFDATKHELNFTATGPSGTFGYVNAYIPKTFVTNIADVKVYLDGNQISFEVSSFDDSWLFHFTYPHSTHNVIFWLAVGSSLPFETSLGNLTLVGIIGVILAVICIGAGYYFLRKRSQQNISNSRKT
jgi:PKD repeat protein